MESKFRLVAGEWDLAGSLPRPLPANWPEMKSAVIDAVPVHHFPLVNGPESSFGPAVLRAAFGSRTEVSHYFCGVDGPKVYVSVIAIGDAWWVTNEHDTVRAYGTTEPADHQRVVGFQDLMSGGYFPCPISAAVSMNEAIELAARVAMNDQTVPYVTVDPSEADPEWLDTVNTAWGLA